MNKKNLVIVHGGAPTAVMNGSLAGAVREAQKHGEVGRILGARHGTGGLMKEDFIDLTDLTAKQLTRLENTPASAIGTSRTPLEAAEYQRMRDVLLKNDVGYVLFNGGNGTMDACGHTHAVCADAGIRVVGIPKTIDNDIGVTDHAPGFGSAARYIAATTADIAVDVRALPIHVCVIEAMGRNAGWITAAAALAKDSGAGADLLYPPERPFDEEEFLDLCGSLFTAQRGVVVVASEGLRDKVGQPIVPPIFKTGRATYFGDVSAHLSMLVIKRLGIKARSEKPGIAGRSALALRSQTDAAEAVEAGAQAARRAIAGESGVMVTLERAGGSEYLCTFGTTAIENVMLDEKKMPEAYLTADHGVSEDFLSWCRPLIGDPLQRFLTLQ